MAENEPQRPRTVVPQQFSLDVMLEKYAKGDERTADDIYLRVARGVAQAEPPERRAEIEARFADNLRHGALGAGRIMSAAGTGIAATLINCFVQPVGDSIQGTDAEGRPGIYVALLQAAETMRRGGGVGYNFSAIRPRGAHVHSTGSSASGPCSYIDVFDASCRTVESAGARRGAQMAVLDCDHPDLPEFIEAKHSKGRWNNFNVSVAVTDAFMRAVENDENWPLVHRAEPSPALRAAADVRQREDGMWIYAKKRARDLWDAIMRSTYDIAEPGVVFISRMNEDNNLRALESIRATNPCVTADTWIMTEEGPAQVVDFVGKPFVARVDGKGFATQSRGFFKTGTRPVLRLSTREGHELRLTADHLVRRVARQTRYTTQVEWTRAEALRPGDEIVLHDHRGAAGWAGTGTAQQGYLIGLLIGDGTLKTDKAVISVWAPELRQVAQSAPGYALTGAAGIIAAAEAAARTLDHRADFRGFQRPVAGGRGEARMASAPLRDLAFSLGMAPGQKTITPAIERQSSDFACAMLRGLFDADGSVQGTQEKGVSVRLTQADVELLQSVQRILLRLGIASTIYRGRKPALARLMPDGRGGAALYDSKELHELVISGDNLRVYAERVGFSDDAKAERLQQTMAGYSRALNRERFTATVHALVSDGIEEVFDATVVDIHAFDANGIYVHNCGEQPLPAYGCCNLGPLDLTRFVVDPFAQLNGGTPSFDWNALAERTATQVRFLDDVLDVTLWPLDEQRAEAAAKRRIGVGFTGLGDTLVMLGIRYNSEAGCAFGARVGETMRDAAYRASVELARERGAFPLFDADKYLEDGTFASRLPDDIKDAIRAHGIRNSHLLSIAPTGTVSLAFADNASNGIEPAFSWTYQRTRRMNDGTSETFTVEDHAWRLYRTLGGDVNALPGYFVSALEMSAQEHIAMMAAVQPFVDTSISKTVNVPADYPFEAFEGLYLDAWRRGLKGLATYRPNETLGAVLQTLPAAEDTLGDALHDPLRVAIDHRPKGELPAVIEKIEYLTQTGKVSLYVAVSFLEVTGQVGGETVTIERPIEFFIPVGQRDESQQWITATMRSLSLAARGGFVARNLQDLRKVSWDRGQVRYGETQRLDGHRAPLWHDSEVAAIAYAIQQILHRRGFLDAEGRQVPTRLLAQQYNEAQRTGHPARAQSAARDTSVRPGEQVLDGPNALPSDAASGAPHAMLGRKCGSCGANAVIRKDGCDFCTACGEIGACG
jgi:ribonucleoside-diphosphate reductase alpha chain